MEKADISVIVGEHLLNYRASAIIKKENKVLVHHLLDQNILLYQEVE